MTRDCHMPENTWYASCYLGPAYYCPVGIWVNVARYWAFSRKTEALYFYMKSAKFKMLRASQKLSMRLLQLPGRQFATPALASMTETILGQQEHWLDPLL